MHAVPMDFCSGPPMQFLCGVDTRKVATSVPMHPGDLNRSLLKKILKQIGWSEEQFRKLL